jgi:hypothetical protein
VDEINERTTGFLTLVFRDEARNPVVPSAATLKIESAKRIMRRATAFAPGGSSCVMEITSDENALSGPIDEERLVTVEFSYYSGAATKHGTAEYRYKVKAMRGVI